MKTTFEFKRGTRYRIERQDGLIFEGIGDDFDAEQGVLTLGRVHAFDRSGRDISLIPARRHEFNVARDKVSAKGGSK